MRFVTYSFSNKTRLGMMEDDQIIDLREVARRYLPGGTPSYLDGMQAFIDAGAKAITTARKAARYVQGLDSKGARRLAQAGNPGEAQPRPACCRPSPCPGRT